LILAIRTRMLVNDHFKRRDTATIETHLYQEYEPKQDHRFSYSYNFLLPALRLYFAKLPLRVLIYRSVQVPYFGT